MYFSTDHGIDKLFPGGEDDPLLKDALDVFGCNLSCCRLGHPDAMPCDREALVRPMLGLFHEIYRERHGSRRDAWAVLEPRIDTLYPRSFDWTHTGLDGDITERAPLFGDLIDAARLVVDDGQNDDSTDLARFTGFSPGTNAQRHILRVAKKGVSLLDLLPTIQSPRTPWSSGSRTPRTPTVTISEPTSPV